MSGFDLWTDDHQSSAAAPPISIHRPAASAESEAQGRALHSRIPTFKKWALVAWSIFTAPFAFIGLLFGEFEFSIVRGGFCIDCSDVHPEGECARAVVGDCDVCLLTVTLDSFGNCPNAATKHRNHRIRDRRAKPRLTPPKEVSVIA